MSFVGARVGHIVIERPLGRGGMGEVFLGRDELLERRVAVKVLRAEQRFSAASRARFVREARLLSRLDHPGIYRVHDLVTTDDADYLILEYVDGPTLRRLDLATLPLVERLRIAEKVATALAAAHRERIVHRDLKPENIMVTAGGEVKVLDFGIARSLSTSRPRPPETAILDGAETAEHTLAELADAADDRSSRAETEVRATHATFQTAAGSVVGTIGYMSPEQAHGAEVSEASDLYAFGVILHELATGAPAYGGSHGVELLLRVAAASTEPVADVDADLAALIRSLESPDPTRRPSAEDAATALQEVLAKPERARRRRLQTAAVAAAVAVTAVAILLTYRLTRPTPLFAPEQTKRLALLPCRNLTGDVGYAWVERGLTEMVATTLDEIERVDVVPMEEVARALAELAVPGADRLAEEEAGRLAHAIGAQLVVDPAIHLQDRGFVLSYRTFNVNGSHGSRSLTATEPVEAARALAARLAPRLNPAAPFVDIVDRYSESPYVNRLYATGVQRLRTLGAKEAVRYFEVCLDAEPDFAWAKLQLAASYEHLDRWDEAATIVDRVRAEATALGNALVEAACLDLLALLRYHRGELDEAYRLGEQALALHRAAGDRSAEAVTLFRLGDARRSQLRWEECEQLYRASLEVRRAIGDRVGEAHSLHGLGVVAAERDRNEQAEELLQRALSLERELGLRRLQAMTLNSLGIMAFRRRDYALAEQRLDESMTIHRALGSEQGVAFALANLGDVARAQGQLDRAYALIREAYDIAVQLGQTESAAFRAFNLAMVLTAMHRPDEAEPFLAEARAWFGDDADVLSLQADIAAERHRYREATALLQRAKDLAGEDWDDEREQLLVDYRRLAAADPS